MLQFQLELQTEIELTISPFRVEQLLLFSATFPNRFRAVADLFSDIVIDAESPESFGSSPIKVHSFVGVKPRRASPPRRAYKLAIDLRTERACNGGMIELLITPLRMLITFALGLVALCLPYRARLALLQAVAAIVHLPFKAFGRLARYLLTQTSRGESRDNPYTNRRNPDQQGDAR